MTPRDSIRSVAGVVFDFRASVKAYAVDALATWGEAVDAAMNVFTGDDDDSTLRANLETLATTWENDNLTGDAYCAHELREVLAETNTEDES